MKTIVWLILPLFLLQACDGQKKAEEKKDTTGQVPAFQQSLYATPSDDIKSRWASYENKFAVKGKGGMRNKGAKGYPARFLQPGQTDTLMLANGPGIIHRFWMTIDKRTPEVLRSMKLEIYWDGEDKPAVQAPFGDFFGHMLGHMASFEANLFSSPEGRSFNCFIPMPFKKGAKMLIINESKDSVRLFYDVNYNLLGKPLKNTMYFHAYWHRENLTKAGRDFEILPHIEGKGRFLGTHMGVRTLEVFGPTWFGEGEVKIYLDGDSDYPTLVGTGTEDYIGTAWGQGEFDHMYQGCLLAHDNYQWSFYRYHVPDPIYFHQDIKVTIQQMAGGKSKYVRQALLEGADAIPVGGGWLSFFEMEDPPDIFEDKGKGYPEEWTNYYRSDDVCATVYFYLDKPVSSLPEINPLEERLEDLYPLAEEK